MARFLTFDLGTTLFKVALFDEAGELLDVERAAPPIECPQSGWAQIDPQRFIETIEQAAGRLRARSEGNFDEVAAVSFATQANSFTLLDAAGEPMMPFILWTDRRAEPLADELSAIAVAPNFRTNTGMPRFAPALALAKVLWLRRHIPKLLDAAESFCFLSDYLTFALCGRVTSEAGISGLSGGLDIRLLRWRENVLESVGLNSIKTPAVLRAGNDLGPVSGIGAERFGLPRNCRVVLGCLDQYAGAIGTGTVSPGQICETTGTVLAAVRCDDHLDPNPAPNVVQGPGFAPDRFFQMSFSSTSANLLEHYRNSLPDNPAFDELTRLAAAASDLSAAKIEPFVDGRPTEDCFRNVRPHHSRGEIVRGIMRCVASALKEQVGALSGDNPPTEIRAAGGGAKSDLWLQIKADLLGIPFVSLQCDEPTSLGAAILAAHGIGRGSIEQIAEKWVRPRRKFLPDSQKPTK